LKKVLVFLAEGFEEVEAITPVDYLRRAGVDVVTASVGSEKVVMGVHKIPVIADVLLNDLYLDNKLNVEDWDAVLCPGGMPGASNIAASPLACSFLKTMNDSGKLVAAICAAPAVVLGHLGLLNGKRFTCFPGMESEVPHGIWQEDKVVCDGHIVTSRGAGTAVNWSHTLIELLEGKAKADALIEKILAKL
jgi:4-methyl-5(b-hydroxyethyl)-thiazole monophosphate biosynthesis